MSISAKLVMELRKKTGAGMMDCKKALTQVDGDFDKATDLLKTKGLATANKKSGRITAEGLTAVAVDGTRGAIIEINSETDFVARNDVFQDLVKSTVSAALECSDIESLNNATIPSGKKISEIIVDAIATIGENLNLRRMANLNVSEGVIASYVHNSSADNMGKIAVLIALESSADKEKLMEFGKQIAMHVAASNPECLNKDSIDPALVQRERSVFVEQSQASGKPANIIEKMVEGRIRKFLEEVVLLEQTFVMDGKTKISDLIDNTSKELGASIALKGYIRFGLGDGIEKEATDFASEVAAASGK